MGGALCWSLRPIAISMAGDFRAAGVPFIRKGYAIVAIFRQGVCLRKSAVIEFT